MNDLSKLKVIHNYVVIILTYLNIFEYHVRQIHALVAMHAGEKKCRIDGYFFKTSWEQIVKFFYIQDCIQNTLW